MFFLFKQKTAYEMRISDWSSDVCSSDLEIAANPGLVLFTLSNHQLRRRLETRCRALGLPHVAALDSVTDALSNILGQETRNRPGRKHILDEAYFARIEAIQ